MLSDTSETSDAVHRWTASLDDWGIPAYILDQAPANPWVHAPAMFRSSADDPTDTPSMREARAALIAPKQTDVTVLDVGCGGGRSSLPLVPEATFVTGIDHEQRMLDQFLEAAAARGVGASAVLGRWPDVADDIPVADVVVCHHVVYNAGDIGRFVRALDSHARQRVVVELTALHPQSSLAPLWKHFWQLERPTEPNAASFVDVVREVVSLEPTVTRWQRAQRPAPIARADLVANVRQRLCLPAERDDEIAALLGHAPRLSADEVVTVAWRPTGASGGGDDLLER
jgi:SAM-dependent methyltransferase